jgi:hypothetical protein
VLKAKFVYFFIVVGTFSVSQVENGLLLFLNPIFRQGGTYIFIREEIGEEITRLWPKEKRFSSL